MNLLALDTSTEFLSLALLKDNDTFTFDVLAGQSHSQMILPKIQALFNEAELSLQDLDGIAFGAGPGSFTGVRIAAGVAQGLAYGAHIPVIGVCTLQALAEVSGASRVIACLDARMGEVYHAAYEKRHNTWHTVLAPNLYKPDAVPAIEGEGFVGAGSGWKTYGETLAHIYATNITITQPEALPTASAMLKMTTPLFAAGLGLPASAAMPIYIRNRVALKSSERALGERL